MRVNAFRFCVGRITRRYMTDSHFSVYHFTGIIILITGRYRKTGVTRTLAQEAVACFIAVTEPAVVAVGINDAFGDETFGNNIEAEFIHTAWGRAGLLAPTRVACLLTIAELAVIPVVIVDALGGGA